MPAADVQSPAAVRQQCDPVGAVRRGAGVAVSGKAVAVTVTSGWRPIEWQFGVQFVRKRRWRLRDASLPSVYESGAHHQRAGRTARRPRPAQPSEWAFLTPRAATPEHTCSEYAAWMNENRPQIPNWFSIDRAKDAFEATYPFHPMVLSVFERKWQELPRFQRTRGILRLLALWVYFCFTGQFRRHRRSPGKSRYRGGNRLQGSRTGAREKTKAPIANEVDLGWGSAAAEMDQPVHEGSNKARLRRETHDQREHRG